jgi:ATP-binding cassette subfamily B protein
VAGDSDNFNLSNFRNRVAYLPRTLKLIWAAAPRWTSAWGVLLFVQGLTPVALVYLTKGLVDSLVAAMNAGGDWTHVRIAIIYVVLTAGVMLLMESLESVTEWVRTAQSELVQDHIKQLVHSQSAAVDIAFYESPEFHDKLDQARGEASTRSLTLLENIGTLLQNSLTLLAMSFLLISYSIWVPLLLLVSTLPAFLVVLRFDRQYHRWWDKATVDRRWIYYYDVMLTHANAAAEIRLFGLGPHFRSMYQQWRARLRSERLRQLRRQSMNRLGAGGAALVVSGVALIWMGWRALNGLASLGDLALFYQAFQRGQSVVKTLLGSAGKIYINTLFLENLFKFLELKPGVVDPVNPVEAPTRLTKGIEFKDITFYYPQSERPALSSFNLTIPAGKVVAIVGANGAGKSTLFKLLCRFYDPVKGSIEIDGTDIRDLSIADLWRQLTVLFQQPLNYHATVAESIAMSDLASEPSRAEIEAAARRAGAHEFITKLPKGYDTLLGKLFAAGAELSGGEWQRVAMARAYMRQSPIILLDEPTSFMDSWSEVDWFNRFRELSEERTAIVITHRFTIAMRADVIFVMDAGQIIESGTHHELLQRDGLYAQSWKAQMEACGAPPEENEPVEVLHAEFAEVQVG